MCCIFLFPWQDSPYWAKASSLSRFQDHTVRVRARACVRACVRVYTYIYKQNGMNYMKFIPNIHHLFALPNATFRRNLPKKILWANFVSLTLLRAYRNLTSLYLTMTSRLNVPSPLRFLETTKPILPFISGSSQEIQ
jgi:hypothetical protein